MTKRDIGGLILAAILGYLLSGDTIGALIAMGMYFIIMWIEHERKERRRGQRGRQH